MGALTVGALGVVFGDIGTSPLYIRTNPTSQPHCASPSRRAWRARCDPDDSSYFLSRITIIPTTAPGMRKWRKKLFVAISRSTASPVEYFRLPSDRTVVMGAHVDV